VCVEHERDIRLTHLVNTPVITYHTDYTRSCPTLPAHTASHAHVIHLLLLRVRAHTTTRTHTQTHTSCTRPVNSHSHTFVGHTAATRGLCARCRLCSLLCTLVLLSVSCQCVCVCAAETGHTGVPILNLIVLVLSLFAAHNYCNFSTIQRIN
jgi:hypothetical protein